MRDIAAALLEPIENLAGGVAFFGHCGGAVLAYEVAHQLRAQGRCGPVQLIVSAQVSPSTPDPPDAPMVHGLAAPELLRHLEYIGGIPPELLSNAELMSFLLPAIRGDLQAIEEYSYDVTQVPLEIPVVALGGQKDHLIAPADLATWHLSTKDLFAMHLFPGGHFFLADFEQQALRVIEHHLRASA
jgi:surfactin synthase thioesterase subunit